ncbi:FxsA family protein [Pseudonocardia sp. MCCB 268]|nr:FxsA family protein [Pseudonocardia cytotoxica]
MLIAIGGVLIFLPGLISDVLGLALSCSRRPRASPAAGWCDAGVPPPALRTARIGTARPKRCYHRFRL